MEKKVYVRPLTKVAVMDMEALMLGLSGSEVDGDKALGKEETSDFESIWPEN